MTLGYRTLVGAEIAEAVDDLARLRIAVFRDWPYLYEGDLAYERRYLVDYAAGNSVLVAAYAGSEMVGASTGMPLSERFDEFSTIAADLPADPADVFYFAESILLEQWRGQGAGHVFFNRRERYARDLGYTFAMFAAVRRPDDHPLRPAGYRALDPFWSARGYAPLEGLAVAFSWRDRGAAEATPKPLQVWMKRL